MEQYTAGIFFDNDIDHINAVGNCNGIHCVKVGAIEDTGKALVNKFPNFVGFHELLSEGGQLAYDEMADAGFFRNEQYDALSGIQEKHVLECEEWAAAEGPNRVALLDFDRTLSLFEGIEPNLIRLGSPVTIEGYANYLFGGTKRVQMLQGMISLLVEKGVSIKILTNNGLCSSPGKLVERLAKTLNPEIEMICSRPPASAPKNHWPVSKLIALVKDWRFQTLCTTEEDEGPFGGGRTRRHKRKNKNRNKNKKLTRRGPLKQ